MRLALPLVLCCSGMLSGCAYFGYYKYPKPIWAPSTEATKVAFPASHEGSVQLTGAELKAIDVALNDFLPPGTTPEGEKDAVLRCLAQRETYHTTVKQVSDDLFFVSFFADLSRCAPGALVVDAGADYLIDGRWKILRKR